MCAIRSLRCAATFKNDLRLKQSGFDLVGLEKTNWQKRNFMYLVDIAGIYLQRVNIRFVEYVMAVLKIKYLECQLVNPIFAYTENLIRETCHHANEM